MSSECSWVIISRTVEFSRTWKGRIDTGRLRCEKWKLIKQKQQAKMSKLLKNNQGALTFPSESIALHSLVLMMSRFTVIPPLMTAGHSTKPIVRTEAWHSDGVQDTIVLCWPYTWSYIFRLYDWSNQPISYPMPKYIVCGHFKNPNVRAAHTKNTAFAPSGLYTCSWQRASSRHFFS